MEHWPYELLCLLFRMFRCDFWYSKLPFVADLSLESQSLANLSKQTLCIFQLPVGVDKPSNIDTITCAVALGCEISICKKDNWKVLKQHPQTPFLERVFVSRSTPWSTRAAPFLGQVTSLTFEGQNNLNADDIQSFLCLKYLTTLTLGAGNMIHSISHLSCLPNLTSLIIGKYNDLNDEKVQHLSCLTNLTRLEIGDLNKLTTHGSHLCLLQNLTTLTIGSYNDLGAEGVYFLPDLQNLTDLEIGCSNKLGTKGAKVLTRLDKLRYLYIGNSNNLGIQGAKHLSSIATLTKLVIGAWNEIEEEGIQSLSRLKNLASLYIGGYNKQGVGRAECFTKIEQHNLKLYLSATLSCCKTIEIF